MLPWGSSCFLLFSADIQQTILGQYKSYSVVAILSCSYATLTAGTERFQQVFGGSTQVHFPHFSLRGRTDSISISLTIKSPSLHHGNWKKQPALAFPQHL